MRKRDTHRQEVVMLEISLDEVDDFVIANI